MKTILLVAVALCGWAICAHASDGYSDPSDFRAPGITFPTSGATINMRDTNPFDMSGDQTTYRGSDMVDGATPGVTYGSSGGQLATQAAK